MLALPPGEGAPRSAGRPLPLRAGQKSWLEGCAMVHGVEDQFHAVGNPQLVEDSEQVFLHRMFAEPQFIRDVAVAESVCNQRDYLLFPRGQKVLTRLGQHLQDGDLAHRVQEISELPA